MIREIDSRISSTGATIALQWNSRTGELVLHVAEKNSLVVVDNVRPADAKLALEHPYAYIGDHVPANDYATY